MYSTNELKDITHFLLEYANRLMGSGVHTSRVVRNTCRIGHPLNVETNVCVMQNNLLVNVRDTDSREVYNEMASIPAFPISFDSIVSPRLIRTERGTRPPSAPGSEAGPRGAAMPSTRIALSPSESFSRPSVEETSRPVSSRTRSKR